MFNVLVLLIIFVIALFPLQGVDHIKTKRTPLTSLPVSICILGCTTLQVGR
jgi:hypothetical protein